MGHLRMAVHHCFACARRQDERAVVFFGPGQFLKCQLCGSWTPEEWSDGVAQIQAVAINAEVRRSNMLAAQAKSLVAAVTPDPTKLAGRIRAPSHRPFYPVPLAFRSQAC